MRDGFSVRLVLFLAVLAFVVLLELVLPRRRQSAHRLSRWGANLSLLAGGALVNVAFWGALSFSLVGLALFAEERRLGLMHRVMWPFWLKFFLGLALLDLAVYLQHWALHARPLLWRLHLAHHTDLDMDVSTGVRFHPLEILFSLGVKAAVVVAFGAHFLAVGVFEALLSAASLFNHANVRFPRGLERFLRLFLVTPDVHRVHHSARKGERDSNFGFTTPWWDRLFGTYEPEPREPQQGMTLGVAEHSGPETRSPYWLLKSPFLK